MRVVFLTELTHTGGVDTFLAGLVRHWPRADDEIWVLANASHPGLPALAAAAGDRAHVEAHGVPVYVDRIVQADAGGKGRIRLLAPLLRLVDAVRGYLGFRRLFRRLAPDRVIIVAGGYPGGDSCRIAALTWAGDVQRTAACLLQCPQLGGTPGVLECARANIRPVAGSFGGLVRCGLQNVRRSQCRCGRCCGPRAKLDISSTASKRHRSRPIRPHYARNWAWRPNARWCSCLQPTNRAKAMRFFSRHSSKCLQRVPTARLVACGYGYPERNQFGSCGLAQRRRGKSRDSSRLSSGRSATAGRLGRSCCALASVRILRPYLRGGDGGWRAGGCDPRRRTSGSCSRTEMAVTASIATMSQDLPTALRCCSKIANCAANRPRVAKQRYARLFTADRMARQYAALIGGPKMSAAIIPANLQESGHL